MTSQSSKEYQFKILFEWAARLWGADRAEDLKPALEQTAAELAQISCYSVDPQEEPMFFL
ncbi:MAG: hypothetical protein L0Y56_20550 [Nitrospira sp.]|nr:hypothetical protein [Nitrospira sp.]